MHANFNQNIDQVELSRLSKQGLSVCRDTLGVAVTESSIRPGGRTERNTSAILRSVLELISVQGMQFTYEDVAVRAGVARRTIHRRWSDRDALIADALVANYRRFKVPTTGNVKSDLRNLAYHFRDFCDNPIEVAINGLAALSPDGEFAQMSRRAWEKSQSAHMEIFEKAKLEGLIRADVDAGAVLDMLMSPIVLHSSILRVKVTDQYLDRLIQHVLMLLEYRPDQTTPA